MHGSRTRASEALGIVGAGRLKVLEATAAHSLQQAIAARDPVLGRSCGKGSSIASVVRVRRSTEAMRCKVVL